MPWDLVRDVPVLWVTGTGVSVEPARSTQLDMLEHRGRPAAGSGRWTCLDLDWRAMFWPSPEEARAEYDQMLDSATVVVGNRAEVEVAVGTADPHEAATPAARPRRRAGPGQDGRRGRAGRDPGRPTVVPPHPVEVVCGLGAGDAFGGALVHGLLAGWDPARIAEYANAAGAVVASRLACADAMPTAAELDAIVAIRGGVRMTDLDRPRPATPTLSDAQWEGLLATRATDPSRAVAKAYAARRRPAGVLSERGTLFLVAADHPARGSLALG